jgi:hypothetical protein
MAVAPAPEAVRRQVGAALAASPAFTALPAAEREAFTNNLAKVGVFLGQNQIPAAKSAPTLRPAARALASAVDDTAKRLAEKPGQVGNNFTAGAMREGNAVFRDLVQEVDFPEFVSGLVKGVFNAVVDASIQQMKAYADMLAAVAKSVDQFADENISDEQARTHLAAQNPQLLEVSDSGSGPRLQLKDGDADLSALGERYKLMSVDVSDATSETALVNAAKLELAQQRQQLLSTMVLMGINRIVITNGRINAKVVFDIHASDQADRQARASMSDASESSSAAVAAVAAPWGAAGGYSSTSHRTTVRSSINDSSESKADMNAKLSGDVLLAFKSETLPLERMLDPGGIQLLTSKSQPLPSSGRPGASPVASPAPVPSGAHP